MNEIFKLLLQSKDANQHALDLAGRELFSKLCIVTSNEDPDNRRRIKVSDPSCPGLETHWLRRLVDHPFLDAPLPEVGQTVLVTWIDGDQSIGFYTSIQNDTNPPFQKEDAIKDSYEATPGNRTETTGQKRYERTSEDHHISVGENLLIENDSSAKIDIDQQGVREDFAPKEITITAGTTLTINNLAGASVTLLPSGAVVIASSNGATLTLGGTNAGGGAQNITWDLGGNSLNIVGTNSVSIMGKQIATLGAIDSDGDVQVVKGWP